MTDQSPDRLDTRVVAAVGVIVSTADKRQPCMTRNISQGGIFVLSTLHAEIGDVVKIEVVHQGNRLATEARVATITPQGLGLTFVEPGPEFAEGITALLKGLVANTGGGPEGRVNINAAWAPPEGEGGWNWLRKRKQSAEIVSLSLDGAAFAGKKKPPVDLTITVYLKAPPPSEGVEQECAAEIVRHTTQGFAVKFISPSLDFRRLVSQLRKADSVDDPVDVNDSDDDNDENPEPGGSDGSAGAGA